MRQHNALRITGGAWSINNSYHIIRYGLRKLLPEEFGMSLLWGDAALKDFGKTIDGLRFIRRCFCHHNNIFQWWNLFAYFENFIDLKCVRNNNGLDAGIIKNISKLFWCQCCIQRNINSAKSDESKISIYPLGTVFRNNCYAIRPADTKRGKSKC